MRTYLLTCMLYTLTTFTLHSAARETMVLSPRQTWLSVNLGLTSNPTLAIALDEITSLLQEERPSQLKALRLLATIKYHPAPSEAKTLIDLRTLLLTKIIEAKQS